MQNWVHEVISKWKVENVKLNPPSSISEIEKAESVLEFKFPQDFKDFYLQANGFDGLDWQEHMFTLWPIELIIREFNDNANKNFIGFCDFLIASHYIGFNKNREGVFKSYGLYKRIEDGELITNSFREIIGMINSNDALIY